MALLFHAALGRTIVLDGFPPTVGRTIVLDVSPPAGYIFLSLDLSHRYTSGDPNLSSMRMALGSTLACSRGLDK